MVQDIDKLTETEKFLVDTFMENTGTHMLDSGGAYGRQWQRNREDGVAKFLARPDFAINTWGGEDEKGSIIKNTYRYLINKLTLTEKAKELNNRFYDFAGQDQFEHDSYYSLITPWLKQLSDDPEFDEFERMGSTNTYNSDNVLDTVLQFSVFSIGEDTFVLLQVHLGADVRGGYTNPRVLQAEDFEDFICDMNDLRLYSEDGKLGFYSDDCGYHWYTDNEGDPDKIVWYDDKAWYRSDEKDSDVELTAS